MTRSSGVHVITRIIHVECDGMSGHTFQAGTPSEYRAEWACKFAGEVDLLIDPETRIAAWTCDTCGTHHEVDYEEATE